MDRLRDLTRFASILNADVQLGETSTSTRTDTHAANTRAAVSPTGILDGLAKSRQRMSSHQGGAARTSLSLDTLLSVARRTFQAHTPARSLTEKLPPELWAIVAEDLDRDARSSFRFSSKEGATLGALPVKGIVVESGDELEQALSAYAPGGLARVTLNRGHYSTPSLEALPDTLHELWLNHAHVDDMDLFPLLQRLGRLKQLHTKGGYGSNLAIAITRCPSLEHIDLDQCYIRDVGATALGKNSAVTSASLFYNCIGVEGAAALAASKSLTDLDLTSNKGIGNEGAKMLALGLFVSLNVRSCNIGDEGALALANNENIKRLNLSNNLLSLNCKTILESKRNQFDKLIL